METNYYALFGFLFKFMYPLFLAPFIFSGIARGFRLRKIWTYLLCLILCFSFPFILMNIHHVKDGAANAGLIAWPIFLIPVSLIIQFLSNLLFFKLLKRKDNKSLWLKTFTLRIHPLLSDYNSIPESGETVCQLFFVNCQLLTFAISYYVIAETFSKPGLPRVLY